MTDSASTEHNSISAQKRAGMMPGVVLAIAIALLGLLISVSMAVWSILDHRTGTVSAPFMTANHIVLEAENGAQAVLTVEGFDAPTLLLYDSNGNVRLELGLSPTGEPFARFLDSSGARILNADTLTQGYKPQLYLRDPETGKRVLILNTTDGVDDQAGSEAP